MSDYQPIDCDQHSVLELLAMHRTTVTLKACEPDSVPGLHTGEVVDVVTRDGAEFLVLQQDSGALSVRLDYLMEIRDREDDVVWRQKSDN